MILEESKVQTPSKTFDATTLRVARHSKMSEGQQPRLPVVPAPARPMSYSSGWSRPPVSLIRPWSSAYESSRHPEPDGREAAQAAQAEDADTTVLALPPE